MSLSLHANLSDRNSLERLLKSLVEIDKVIADCLIRDEALIQQQTHLLQQQKELEFRRKTLKKALEAARSSKRATKAAAESIRCLTSPIAHFPVEILAQIFQTMVDCEDQYRRNRMEKWQATSYTPIPITLGQVCSRWRYIVNENTAIWRCVNIKTHGIKIDLELEVDRAHLATRTARWKQQGMQTTQALLIDTWTMGRAALIKSIIGSHETPWESIQIAVGNSPASGYWDVHLASAKSVVLCRAKPSASLAFFKPLLQYASSINIMGTAPDWGNTPWSSLQSLKLRPFTKTFDGFDPLAFGPEELRDLLNAIPYLNNLELDFTIDPDSDGGPDEVIERPIEHTSLKSLSLHLHHLDTDASPFGIRLSAPSLQNLTVLSFNCSRLDTDIPRNGTWEHITSIALRALREHEVLVTVELLQKIPNVTTLDVQGRHIDKLITLINAFYHPVPPHYATLPLSRLTKIVFERTDIQGETLIVLVEQRLKQLEGGMEGMRAIKEVDLYESPGVTLADWKRLGELLELGRAIANDSWSGEAEMRGR